MDLKTQIKMPSMPAINIPVKRVLWWVSIGAPVYVIWFWFYIGHIGPRWVEFPAVLSGLITGGGALFYSFSSLFRHFDRSSSRR